MGTQGGLRSQQLASLSLASLLDRLKSLYVLQTQ
jgi:hypothetical protein